MALTFPGSVTYRVDIAGTMMDNLGTGTIAAWVYWNSSGADDWICAKNSGGNLMSFGAAGNPTRLRFDLATSGTNVSIVGTNSTLVTGSWQFQVVSWVYNGASTAQHLYTGDLSTMASEVSYASRSTPSGSVADNSGDNFAIGNAGSSGANSAYSLDGTVSVLAVWDSQLTLGQLRSFQFWPRNIGCIGFWILDDPAATQPDLSGNGGAGTISGSPTQGNHAPIGPLFRGINGFRGLPGTSMYPTIAPDLPVPFVRRGELSYTVSAGAAGNINILRGKLAQKLAGKL